MTKKALPEKSLACVVLAAGKGTRMKSRKPKVLHEIAGLSMISHVVKTAESIGCEKIVSVIGPDMDDVAKQVAPHETVVQQAQKGTADAVKAALPVLDGFEGSVLVLYGDVPLIGPDTLKKLVDHHNASGDFGATVLAMVPPDPTGYGRIVQNSDGTLSRIVEEADANDTEKQIRLSNSGVMVVDGKNLAEWINEIGNDNAQGEYYLVDLVEIIQKNNKSCGVIRGDYNELQGVNSRAQLAALEYTMQMILRMRAFNGGATMIDPETVYFSWDTKIGQDVMIEPNVFFGPDVSVQDNVHIKANSHIEGAVVKEGAVIGPFARLRPGADIGEGTKIGNFVEVKNSVLHAGVKAGHLAYIGDAEIGAGTNYSCGAITANYDGKKKHKTKIGKDVMIGSDCVLVAPVEIGDEAYIAAGSTITRNVPEQALAVARAGKARIIENWVHRKTGKGNA